MEGPTRLRFATAKSPERIVEWVNQLPYKIEIKSGPTFANGRWSIWFILPDRPIREVESGKID